MRKRKPMRLALPAGLSVIALLLPGCGSQPPRTTLPSVQPAVKFGDHTPRREPLCRKGNPPSYDVFGKRYFLMKSGAGYVEKGAASWYGPNFQGHKTSCGQIYDMYEMTAAHKTLPIPTYCEVTNLDNGRKVTVKVNDRGPFHDDRIIDLSYAAALKLGIVAKGTGNVEVRALDAGLPISAEGGELAQNPSPSLDNNDTILTDSSSSVSVTTSLSKAEVARLADEVKTEERPDTSLVSLSTEVTSHEGPSLALTARDRGTQLLPAQTMPVATAAPVASLERLPPPLPLPTSVPSTSNGTFVQVGAFAQRDNAERLKSELNRVVDERVQIYQSDRRSGGLYRVHIGPLSDSAAGRVSQTLLRLGLPSRLIVD